MSVVLKYKYKSAPFKAATIVDIYIKTLTSDSSCDPNVLMMLVLPKNYLNEPDTIFSHIATPVDMLDYPVGYDPEYPYFRTDNTILRVGSPEQAESVILNMKKGIDRLNKALQILDQSDSSSSGWVTA